MAITTISSAIVYGSSLDPKFQTTDRHEAEAFEYVHGTVAKPLRERWHASGRFTTDSRLDGAVQTFLEELVWVETMRRHGTPTDYLGIDTPKVEFDYTATTLPASQIGLVGARGPWNRDPMPPGHYAAGLEDEGDGEPMLEQVAAVGAQA